MERISHPFIRRMSRSRGCGPIWFHGRRVTGGGASYIVLGDVAPIASFSPTPKLYCDEQIESFRLLADAVHEYGCKLGVQIFHPEYDCDAINALFQQGKMNEVRAQLHHDMEHFTDEVSEGALLKIIDKMCACAVRAEKAGVDVIQVHGDRLVGCLCSTRMNRRTDKFGGSLENRTRFALMLVRSLREAVPDMIIDYKFPIVTSERGKGGIDLCDAPQFARWVEEAGVDMLHVAQANHTGNMADIIPPMGVQPYGFFVDITGQIKEAVSIPVSAVGRIIDPKMAERIVVSGKADMVGIGRGFLADEDWVRKVEEGRADQIIRCLSCNKGCADAIQRREGLSCVLNPELRRAVQDAVKAARGAGVKFELGHEATAEELAAAGFDHVIVAVGAQCACPPIPGRELANVVDSWSVLAGTAEAYGKVAVIGGGMVAARPPTAPRSACPSTTPSWPSAPSAPPS